MSLHRQPGMLCFHTHDLHAPWQTEEWREEMRRQLRPSAFLRFIENRFTSGEGEFVDMTWFDQCVDPDLVPQLLGPRLPVWFGLDASTKRDSTAIAGCTFDPVERKVRLVTHKTFHPSKEDPLDFETTVEETLLDYRARFRMVKVYFDPWQLVSVSQRLIKRGLPMEEFPQTLPNLTEASQNLYDLIKSQNLVVYPDQELRQAISHAVAKEGSRGWRIGKEKQSHKIDLVVALAQAALSALKAGYTRPRLVGAW